MAVLEGVHLGEGGGEVLYGDGSADAAGNVYVFKCWLVEDGVVVLELTAACGPAKAASLARPYSPQHCWFCRMGIWNSSVWWPSAASASAFVDAM